MTAISNRLSPKSRSRSRIGADQAVLWARKLRLGNPYGKSILRAIANYMNEDGSAYPGIETLALDTDIGVDTVISRLRWLESIGAIAMFKCWVDENGRRNHDGRGRVTSSEIRFLFDTDKDEIEAAAIATIKPRELTGAAKIAHITKESSPRPDRELDDESSYRPDRELNPASPGVALDQLSTRSTRTEEQKKEDSPPTPQAGGDGFDSWLKFERAWTEPILRQSIARQVWQALSEAERATAISAARGYVAWRMAQKKPPNVINAHTFLREREAWPGFIKHAQPEPKAAFAPEKLSVPTGSDEFEAIELMRAILRSPFDRARPAIIVGKVPCGAPALRALITRDESGEIDKSGWFITGKDTPEFTAWCQRIKEWLGIWPEPYRIWLDLAGNIDPHSNEADRDRYWRETGQITPSKFGLLVPIKGFPPAKGEAVIASSRDPPKSLCTEEELKEFGNSH